MRPCRQGVAIKDAIWKVMHSQYAVGTGLTILADSSTEAVVDTGDGYVYHRQGKNPVFWKSRNCGTGHCRGVLEDVHVQENSRCCEIFTLTRYI